MKYIFNENQYIKVKNKILTEDVDFSSFEMKDTLCPDIFDMKNKMLPEVRKKLLAIGKQFYKAINIDWVQYTDIILTGSLANYNWSKFSDVDLHVVVPYNQISKNADLVEEFTWAEKELWNAQHDITIEDYDVEVYVQDSNAELVAGGVYSILYDKWIKTPQKIQLKLDKKSIDNIVNSYDDKVEDLIRRYVGGNCYGLMDDVDELKAEISNMRKKGLNTVGEFSTENIAFKAIRRIGLLDKLDKIKNTIFDSSLSVGKPKEKSDFDIEPKKNNSPIDDIKKSKDVQKKSNDNIFKKTDEKPKEKGEKSDDVMYMINGKKYDSLRHAEKALGIAKSTIEYRVKSDNPDYSSYKKI